MLHVFIYLINKGTVIDSNKGIIVVFRINLEFCAQQSFAISESVLDVELVYM